MQNEYQSFKIDLQLKASEEHLFKDCHLTLPFKCKVLSARL